MSISRSLFALTFLATSVMSASAQITMFHSLGDGTPTSDVAGAYGVVFISSQNLTVRALGFYDHGGDGLSVAHRIGMGSGSGEDVWPFFEITVPEGTEAIYRDGFRWVNLITPLELYAGVYYTLAGEMIMGVDPMLNHDHTAGSVIIATEIGAPVGRRNAFGDWANPVQQSSADQVFMVVNLSEEVIEAIPEPSSVALLTGGALCGLAWLRRQRNQRRSKAGL